MKKILLAVLLIVVMGSCKKDDGPNLPLVVGKSYAVKSDIFSKGAYQPVSPVTVENLYIDPTSGLPYATVSAIINWNNFNKDTPAGQLTLEGLTQQGIKWGDQKYIDWYIPQGDLSH